MNFKVVPIPAEISGAARATMVSPQYESLPAFSAIADGYGPCRSCLDTFREGEERRTSFTYNPFDRISKIPQPGPVFIHSETCDEFRGPGFPAAIRHLPMLLEAFDQSGEFIERVPASDKLLESQIAEILSQPEVRLINLRNAEAGCFIARIERA
jgi:hypothetical protein